MIAFAEFSRRRLENGSTLLRQLPLSRARAGDRADLALLLQPVEVSLNRKHGEDPGVTRPVADRVGHSINQLFERQPFRVSVELAKNDAVEEFHRLPAFGE